MLNARIDDVPILIYDVPIDSTLIDSEIKMPKMNPYPEMEVA